MQPSSFQSDHHLIEALETAPAPAIPQDFAARIAKQAQALGPLPAPTARPSRRPHYGRTAAWASLIVMAAITLMLFPHATHTSSPLFIVQAVLLTQMIALALWLSSRYFPENA